MRLDGETRSIMLCRMACLSAVGEENLTRSSDEDVGDRPKRLSDSPT